MNLKRPQLITLGVAIVAIVLFLLLPRAEEKTDEVDAAVSKNVALDYGSQAQSNLSAADQSIYEEFQNSIANATDPLQKIELLDSLSHFWEDRGELILAADELQEIALIIGDKPSYFIAGDKYFSVFQNTEGENKKVALQKAIESYETVLEMNPDDLEAMTSLGVCYVEGSSLTGEPPMKGIGMLTKVLQIDPNNINALVNLGYFATRSGQFEKAIERFKRVIEIDPTFTDGYLYLSDAYLQAGKKEEAAQALEEFMKFIEDEEKKQQLEIYIEQIRNNSI